MKKMLLGSVTGLALLGISVGAQASTILVDQGASWSYTVLQTDLWSNWGSVTHDSVVWEAASWQSGDAAFGNLYSLKYNTDWTANTDLALEKTFDITGLLSSPVTLNVAVDNGFIVFINGVQVAKENAEGYTNYWEYTLQIDQKWFTTGENTIQVLAEDHGGATFFDLKMTADVTPIPEPASLLLLGAGLVSLAGMARRKMIV
ncbi:MAG: PEP-CTERM sorting domain-containing protein [Desulfobulbus sp.]|nr:PEP-CTERM sorting domain-containing protein [Desulfobulbus sp.]